ncbi:MAG: OmpA family protein [Balneolaceae bacterium]
MKNYLITACIVCGFFILLSGCKSAQPVTETTQDSSESNPLPEKIEDEFTDEVEEEAEEPEIAESLNTVSFGFDLHNISDPAARLLAENVETLNEAPATRIRIDAYTDHVGGDQYNLRLSVRRANAVADFYTRNGISEDRIDRRGLGKHPVPCTADQADPGYQVRCEANRIAESHPIKPDTYSP